jgi:aminoglycoside phosphotransferase (APT) family kinase protein
MTVGTFPTLFDHPVSTIDELAAEIRHGRCRPFLKEITHAGATSVVTEIVIGTKGESEQRPRIVLRRMHRRKDWEKAVQTADLMSEIAALGFGTKHLRLPEILEKDPGRLTIIEEGVRGRPLFERLRTASPEEGRLSLRLAAGWLARLHNLGLALTPREAFLEQESRRLEGYAERFEGALHPRAPLVRRLASAILEEERRIVAEHPEVITQCHGDYHPKNVIIGREKVENEETVYVAAVDLENAVVAPRAFDVGWFIAHYRHQFAGEPNVPEMLPGEIFVEEYRRAMESPLADFDRQVLFFTARAELSIASYLVKLGLGESEAVERLLFGTQSAIVGAGS